VARPSAWAAAPGNCGASTVGESFAGSRCAGAVERIAGKAKSCTRSSTPAPGADVRLSDRLALAEAIEDAGIERTKATRLASVIFNAIHENVATKADVQASEASVRADFEKLRADFAELRGEMRTDFATFRGEARADIARLDGGQGRILERMDGMQNRLLIRLGGGLGSLIIAAIGALFWALQHWPPHG
jgi:hypothetical protein